MIKFGVAGNSKSFYDEGYTATVQAAEWCRNRGLDVFEYSFGKGANLSIDTAGAIGKEFARCGVELTAHAPYFINFANPDPEKIEKSIQYVISTIKRLDAFGGDRVVVHPASQGKMSREEAFSLTKQNVGLLAESLRLNGLDRYKICFETMGKTGQIGTVDEIVELCAIDAMFYPCMDFGHINAREQGILKSAVNYNTIIQKMLDFLPKHKVFNMHVHFSKIEYGAKGEIRHLTFSDTVYGPEFDDFNESLHLFGLEPVIISESDGTQAEDAAEMKRRYFSYSA